MIMSSRSLPVFHLDDSGLGTYDGRCFGGRHQWLERHKSTKAVTTEQQPAWSNNRSSTRPCRQQNLSDVGGRSRAGGCDKQDLGSQEDFRPGRFSVA